MPPLTDKELLIKTGNWAQALHRFIPERRLQECYLRAVEDHESEYPISALSLKAAWKKICAEDKHRRDLSRLSADKSSMYMHAIACYRCRDTNVEPVYDRNGKYLGSKPGCDHRPLEPDEWLYKEELRLDQLGQQLARQARDGEARIIDLKERNSNVINF